MKKNNLTTQSGFTLIEIIAVLIIISIVAAVSIQKYMDLQHVARQIVLESAFASGAATMSLDFSKFILEGNQPEVWGELPDVTDVQLGDFVATISYGCGIDAARVTITNGPTGWASLPSGFLTFKDFTICK